MGTGGKNRLLAGLGLAASLFFGAGDRINTSYNTAPTAAYAQALESPEPAGKGYEKPAAAAKPQAGLKGYRERRVGGSNEYVKPEELEGATIVGPVKIHMGHFQETVKSVEFNVNAYEGDPHIGWKHYHVSGDMDYLYWLAGPVPLDKEYKFYTKDDKKYDPTKKWSYRQWSKDENLVIKTKSKNGRIRIFDKNWDETLYFDPSGYPDSQYKARIIKTTNPKDGEALALYSTQILSEKEYRFTIDTDTSPNPELLRAWNISYEPDPEKDGPEIHWAVGRPYMFKNTTLPWDAFWAAIYSETNEPKVILSGTVDFDFSNALSRGGVTVERNKIKAYLRDKTTEKYATPAIPLDEFETTKERPYIWSFDTKTIPSRDWVLGFEFDSRGLGGVVERKVRIQNPDPPTVTGIVTLGQPNETSLPSFYDTLPPQITDRSFFTLNSGRLMGGIVEYPAITDRMNVYLDGRNVYKDSNRSDLFPLTVTTDSSRKDEAHVFIPSGNHKLVAEAVYGNIVPDKKHMDARFKVFDIEVVPSGAAIVAQK